MAQEKYISRNSQDAIRISKETLEESPVLDLGKLSSLDLENWKTFVHMDDDHNDDDHNDDDHNDDDHNDDDHNDDDHHNGNGSGQTQSSLCSHIVLKNIITVIDANIVTCTGVNPATCATACPDEGIITPNIYINMMAIVNLVGIAQTGIVIQFHYLINNIPVTDPLLTNVTVNLVPGNNYVYLFPTNQMYIPHTMVTFYGALVTSQ